MCTEKYINPFTGFGFKLLFGTPANKEFLITFLNSLFDDREKEIVDISYNAKFLERNPDYRNAVYDLYCEISDGSHIIVEMQNAYQWYFLDRTVFYSSFPIQALDNKKDWDYQLPPIYIVTFLNRWICDYTDGPDYKHIVRLSDINTKNVFFDKLTYIYLEMPKFDKDEHALFTPSEYWLYALNNLCLFDSRPEILSDKVFDKLFEVAEIANFDKEQRWCYEDSLKHIRDYVNTLRYAYENGLEKRRVIQRAKGYEKGIAKGLEKAREIIKSFAMSGMPLSQIAETLKMSIPEVEDIIKA